MKTLMGWSLTIEFLLGSWFCVPNVVVANDELPSLTNPNRVKVSNNIYAFIGDMDVPNALNQGFISNSVVIITASSVVVVDPGGSLQIGQMLINEIKKLTNNPISHVFNTHHHADHWMGNQAFSQLTPPPEFVAHFNMKESAADIGEQWIKIIAEMTHGANKGTAVVLPNKLVSKDAEMTIGGINFQLYHPAHAHTKGDLAIYLPDQRVLIAGDILFYQRTPGFQDASPSGNALALEHLRLLAFDYVIPGHGPITEKAGMQSMLEYIYLLQKQVKQYFDAGLQDFEMKTKIDMGKFQTMSGFSSRFGINVNRVYLEVEAASFQ